MLYRNSYRGELSLHVTQALGESPGLFVLPMPEIEIVLKNRQYSNTVSLALLSVGFELKGKTYQHDGCHLHLETPTETQKVDHEL